MTHKPLAIKWRPTKLDNIVGQNDVVKSLKNIIVKRINNSTFLFYGSSGVGKTTMARILAKSLNCENKKNYNLCKICEVSIGLDIIEIDGASKAKVDDIREFLNDMKFSPVSSKYN